MRRAMIAEAVRYSIGEETLTPAIQQEILALARIDERYASLSDQLKQRCGSERSKARVMRILDERHRRERKPHVLRVARLYQELTSLRTLPDRRTVH